MKPLPLKLWLALEDDVACHKAEIAARFAEARKRAAERMPEPMRIPQCWRLMQQLQASEAGRRWTELSAQQQKALSNAANPLRGQNEALGAVTLLGFMSDPRSVGWL